MQTLAYTIHTCNSIELQKKSKKIQKTQKRPLKRKSVKVTSKGLKDGQGTERYLEINKDVVNISRYRIISQIAFSNSKIQKAIDIETQTITILKEHYSLDAYDSEARALCQLDHPNLIKLLNFVQWSDNNSNNNQMMKNFALSIEYASKGDLASYWKYKKPFNENIARVIFKQIVAGLSHMHERELAHMDLKLENVFVTDNFQIKIGDFDHCSCTGIMVKNNHGTPGYLAPEMFKQGKHYGKPTDIFALGIILFMLCTGRRPMQIENGVDDVFYRCIKDNNINFFLDTVSRIVNITFTQEFKRILEAMLRWEPNRRPLLYQLNEFEWLKKYNEDDLEIYYNEMKSRMPLELP